MSLFDLHVLVAMTAIYAGASLRSSPRLFWEKEGPHHLALDKYVPAAVMATYA